MSAPGRPLGLVAATALVAGNIVGSGLFLLPAALAPYGLYGFAGWGLAIAGALVLAVLFAWLAARHPLSGGPYVYVRLRLGELPGFLIAWSYWLTLWTAVAAIAIAFAGYAGSVLPALSATPLAASLTAVAAIWACSAINLAGIGAAGVAQVLTTVLKGVPLLLVGLAGFAFIDWQALPPVNPRGEPLLAVATATGALALWSLVGLESAGIVAGAVRDPVRNVPRATLIGTALAASVTLVACGVVQLMLPLEQLAASTAPFADAAAVMFGAAAGPLVGLVAAVSCLGALNGWILLQGQFPTAAAADGLLPAPLARLDARGVPRTGMMLGSALASVLVLANAGEGLVAVFTFAILLSTALTLLPYLACSIACLVRREPAPVGIRVLGVLGAVFSAWALYGTGAESLAWGAALLVAGLPWYAWQRRRGAVPPPRQP